MKQIAVLICDVTSSRKIEDREEAQRGIKKILHDMEDNREEKGLIAKPSITRGDEFEIAFEHAAKCFKGLREIEREFHPYRFRGGIGIGRIDTEIRDNTAEMDGPAFHRARKALEEAAETKEQSIFLVRGGDRSLEEPLDPLLRLLYSVKNDWTKREREFAEHYLSKDGGVTHKDIGNHFGVSRSTVSRTLSRAHLSTVERAENYVLERLSEFGGG